MKRDATVFVPGVVSLAASSRRTLKHGDTFAMFDEFGDVLEVERSPYGLFHYDTRFLSQLLFTIEGHRPLMLSSTVQTDNVTLDVDLTNPDIFVDGQLVLGKETFHVARAKFLWEASCYELFTITSYSASPARLRFALDFDADFADLFATDALAEVPLAATVGGQVVAGFADRLLVTPDEITVVDFKTARRPPASLAEVPLSTLRQMAAYAAALGEIYPGRRVRAGVLYTHAPRLIEIPATTLAEHKAALSTAQESFAALPVE